MTAPGVSPRSDEEGACQMREPCEHHWISTHQPDFPDAVYWIRQCSLCGDFDGADLSEQVAAALLVEREDQDRRIEAAYWQGRADGRLLNVGREERVEAERDALVAERDELRAKVAAVEAQRDDALVLLADAIPDPKGAIDSPQWHRRMDRLAASLDDGTAREFNDCRSTSHDVGAALAAASPGDGLGVWCCPAGHEIDQAGMCACDPPAPEWTFEDVDDEHTLITIRHADGSEIKYRVRRRPLFGASPGDEETDDV